MSIEALTTFTCDYCGAKDESRRWASVSVNWTTISRVGFLDRHACEDCSDSRVKLWAGRSEKHAGKLSNTHSE